MVAKALGRAAAERPYANADEANHAPNENFEIARFYGGIKIAASVYETPATRSQ